MNFFLSLRSIKIEPDGNSRTENKITKFEIKI